MDEKIKEAVRFYLYATKLKNRIRSAWDKDHWNVKSERIESIAEHVYGVCILAISLDSEFDLGIDMNKALKMLTIHEIGEVLIGDYTPFDISQSEKEKIEHKAMADVLGNLCKKEEMLDLLIEFDERKTKEAQFCYLCDKLEANLQSKVYQDQGYQRDLDDQEGNVVMGHPRIQQIIEDGAQTAFDVWYYWDEPKFKNDPIFAKTMQYIKENNTNI